MAGSTPSGSLVQVGYWIFWLEWGSKDSKTVPEFYGKNLWI